MRRRSFVSSSFVARSAISSQHAISKTPLPFSQGLPSPPVGLSLSSILQSKAASRALPFPVTLRRAIVVIIGLVLYSSSSPTVHCHPGPWDGLTTTFIGSVGIVHYTAWSWLLALHNWETADIQESGDPVLWRGPFSSSLPVCNIESTGIEN